MIWGKFLQIFGLFGTMVVGTSCKTNSSNNLAQLFAPTTVKQTVAEVDPAKKDTVAKKDVKVETEIKSVAQKKAAPKVEPISSVFLSGSSSPQTGFNFPSMVGSNLLVRTTAYCHKEADSLPYGRLNAAGGVLQYGSVIRSAAADWSRFPLGTRFRIQGEPHEYIIDDYGSALVGTNTIDIYKPTFTAMNAWGVRRVPIQIIEWGCFHKSRQILDGRKHVKGADHVRQMLNDINSRYSSSYRTAQNLGPIKSDDSA